MGMLNTRFRSAILVALLAVFALVAANIGSGLQTAGAAVKMVPANFTELAEKARPGVVNIRTVKTVQGGGRVFRHFFGQPFDPKGGPNPFEEFFGPFMREDPRRDFKQRSLGSGFIIDTEGHIVTNNHVIDDADQIKVKLSNGKEYDAELVGRDPSTDLALIKIDPKERLTPLRMVSSAETAVGNWVVAIGSPFGLEQTVTAGIVSAKGRVIGNGPYDDFIQTDASINPGNSGGPLLNLQGDVIGINTAIVASGQGIGFAIPTSTAIDIIAQIQNNGEVTRGWLGVGIQDLSPELSDYYKIEDGEGALVTMVYEGDPADKAGIQAKDVIVAVGGEKVTSSRDLTRIIATTPVGKRTAIELIRDGKKKTVYVSLGKRDEEKLAERVQPGDQDRQTDNSYGFTVEGLTPEIASLYNLSESEQGVIVTQVDPDSKAAEAGIMRGDIIKEVDRQPVETVEQFKTRMNETKDDETVQLLIKRGRVGYVVIKLMR
jgi:serine protease Do